MIPFSQLINASQPGTMVQHLFSLDGAQAWTAGLAIRESRQVLAGLPARVDILSRGALIQVEEVHLIVLMLHLNGRIYESFVSIQHEDSPEFVALMARQESLSIHFFDGVAHQPVRALLTQNGFQPLFAWVSQIYLAWPAWYFHEFDEAKKMLYKNYPRPEDLWQALGKHSGGSTGL